MQCDEQLKQPHQSYPSAARWSDELQNFNIKNENEVCFKFSLAYPRKAHPLKLTISHPISVCLIFPTFYFSFSRLIGAELVIAALSEPSGGCNMQRCRFDLRNQLLIQLKRDAKRQVEEQRWLSVTNMQLALFFHSAHRMQKSANPRWIDVATL